MTSYSLADLSDLLPIADVQWPVLRSDEFSGAGDGSQWASEMAPPIWSADVALAQRPKAEAKRIEARVNALSGPIGTMLFCDPWRAYPAADPKGGLLGASVVTVSDIASGRRSITLVGLPAGYVLTEGDRLSINYGSGRVYYGEISAPAVSDAAGLAQVDVFPGLPLTIAVSDAVTLKRPAMKCFIAGWSPYTTTLGRVASGASLRLIQRVR